MPKLSSEEIRRFEKEGFIIVRNAYSDKETESFKNAILKLKAELYSAQSTSKPIAFKGSPFNYDELERVPFDDRILDIAKSLLGDSLVYFGDSSVNMGGGGASQRGFHRDCVNRFNLFGPDWDADYPLLRIGIYLGDFSVNSGGLKIIPGSHRPRFSFLRRIFLRSLKHQIRIFSLPFDWLRRCLSIFQGGYNIPSRTGDIVAWSFRLLHSAGNVRLKRWSTWSLPVWIENALPKSWIQPGGEQRMVMFVAFAADGPHLDRYLATRRPSDLEWWKTIRWDGVIEQWAREKGIRLRKPDPAVGELFKPRNK